MPSKERYLITSALPYVNNVPHIGNIVGSHLPADVYARYCRLKGRETLFIGGTDEHGSPSEIAAEKAGISPKELCDTFYTIHNEIYKWFNISYDNFSRTSRKINHKMTQEFFWDLYNNGFISEGETKQPYCNHCKRFLADRFVEGKCPHCGSEGARGDQCEKCSSLLNPEELIEPKCAICGSKPEIRKTKHLFLNLDALEKDLKKWIEEKENWKPQVRNLALGWISEGLKKRGITRDLKWGVKVPLKGYEDKVFYVWFDAPIGYLSSTKEWIMKKMEKKANEGAEGNAELEKEANEGVEAPRVGGSVPLVGAEKEFDRWWKGKETKLVHFIGKDNIPFHTIFFPGMIMGGKKYILPYDVAGYQFLNYEGGKISKSKGHGVFCESLLEQKLDIPSDVWRFYLIMKLPEVRDTEFTWNEFESRINTELVGNLGNFVNRTLVFAKEKMGGEIRKPKKLAQEDERMLGEMKKSIEKVGKLYDGIEFVQALSEIFALSAKGNQYFQASEPWKKEERREGVIYVCSKVCNAIAVMIAPVMPDSAKKIRKMLNLSEEFEWKDALDGMKSEKIGKTEILFTKMTKEKIEEAKGKATKVGKIEERLGKHKAQKHE